MAEVLGGPNVTPNERERVNFVKNMLLFFPKHPSLTQREIQTCLNWEDLTPVNLEFSKGSQTLTTRAIVVSPKKNVSGCANVAIKFTDNMDQIQSPIVGAFTGGPGSQSIITRYFDPNFDYKDMARMVTEFTRKPLTLEQKGMLYVGSLGHEMDHAARRTMASEAPAAKPMYKYYSDNNLMSPKSDEGILSAYLAQSINANAGKYDITNCIYEAMNLFGGPNTAKGKQAMPPDGEIYKKIVEIACSGEFAGLSQVTLEGANYLRAMKPLKERLLDPKNLQLKIQADRGIQMYLNHQQFLKLSTATPKSKPSTL